MITTNENTTLLGSVKALLGITIIDADLDKNLNLNIESVKGYLVGAGVTITTTPETVIDAQIVSCIAIGVNDLLNNKAGETKFSPAFNMFAMQLSRG